MKPDHPQRLVPPAPPGALFKRLTGIARVREVESGKDEAYLAAIRQLPCLKCGGEPSEAAHVRMQSGTYNKRSGMGMKPDDRYALPLCTACHRLDRDAQHQLGERCFWFNLGINPLFVAQGLYAKRGDLVAMRAVIFNAIATRDLQEQHSRAIRV